MNVVDIKQRERQCSQLIELRNKLNAGVLITHILNVKISNQPQDVTYASKLRRKLFLKLSNKVFTRRIAHNGSRERMHFDLSELNLVGSDVTVSCVFASF